MHLINSAIVPEGWRMMEHGDHMRYGAKSGIRGPANGTVPTQVIRQKGKNVPVHTYGAVLGDDLAISQSQETLVNSCLVQLWRAYKIARCTRSSPTVYGRRVPRLLTFVRFLWVVHQGLDYHFDLGTQRLGGV